MKGKVLYYASTLALVFFAGHLTGGMMARSTSNSVAHHWRAVEEHIAYISDPSNYEHDAATGFSAIELRGPDHLQVHLAALVAAGEIRHADLVLPNVPRTQDVTEHWVRFIDEHDGIIFGTGNPSYVAFQPSGEQPTHLNLWFRTDAQAKINQLVKELEEMVSNRPFPE